MPLTTSTVVKKKLRSRQLPGRAAQAQAVPVPAATRAALAGSAQMRRASPAEVAAAQQLPREYLRRKKG